MPDCNAGEATTMAGDQRYLAFMVRLWTVHHDGELMWRASVEDAHTSERHAFADVAELFDFLQLVMDRPAASRMRDCRTQLDDDSWLDQL
jgi:hypothetical protein